VLIAAIVGIHHCVSKKKANGSYQHDMLFDEDDDDVDLSPISKKTKKGDDDAFI